MDEGKLSHAGEGRSIVEGGRLHVIFPYKRGAKSALSIIINQLIK